MTRAISRRGLALGAAAAAAGCTSERDVFEGTRYAIPPAAQRLAPDELERVIVDSA
jgi:hypothetical protein